MTESLLTVENLNTYFYTEEGVLKAVDDVSFEVQRGQTLGIVGESGCGKSITSLSVMQLVPQPRGRIVGGTIRYNPDDGPSVDVTSLQPNGAAMRDIRGNAIAMVFQEPMTSLNPVYTIGNQITEAVELHQRLEKGPARERAIAMLDKVRISAPRQRVDEYPHELSGGMRQRAMIAMALSCNPSLLIADEPTTALDVTIEAQILDLMQTLQQEIGMSIVIITHDLGVIGEIADRVIVMYMGKVVEQATTDEIFYNPKHPYTSGLLNSIPQIGVKKRLVPIPGNVPSPYFLPAGCYFSPRCAQADSICRQEDPPSFEVGPEHFAKCWLCR